MLSLLLMSKNVQPGLLITTLYGCRVQATYKHVKMTTLVATHG